MRNREKDAEQIAENKHKIMETGFRMFSERGIDPVTMPEVAGACGIGRATIYRYFNNKAELVTAIGAWKWQEYISDYQGSIPAAEREALSGKDHLGRYLDSFIDLYRNHEDILRFNQYFNIYMKNESGPEKPLGDYGNVISGLGAEFHKIYRKGQEDRTLRSDVTEKEMFSATFHIMLAAATRYAGGLIFFAEEKESLVKELAMLKEMLLTRFANKNE